MKPDFGDKASGRVVNENDNFRLVRPYRFVSGTVVGVFPYAPKNATVAVATASGETERLTIRVEV